MAGAAAHQNDRGRARGSEKAAGVVLSGEARPLADAVDACPPEVRLSPWPEGGEELESAIAKLRRVIVNLEDDARASEIGGLAAALIEKYAPGAPAAVKDEAAIRFAGYLAQSSSFGAILKGGVGPLSIEYQTNHAAMFRNCGAAALLTHWKIRRAGVIG